MPRQMQMLESLDPFETVPHEVLQFLFKEILPESHPEELLILKES
jgi:hypothetical protein